MERVLRVEHPRAPRGSARDLDRRLHGLRAAVGGHHRLDAAGRSCQQLLGQDAAQQRHPKLRQVGGVSLHNFAHGGDRPRMVAPDGEDAVATEEVEVAPALGVDQVRALPSRPDAVEAERAQDAP